MEHVFICSGCHRKHLGLQWSNRNPFPHSPGGGRPKLTVPAGSGSGEGSPGPRPAASLRCAHLTSSSCRWEVVGQRMGRSLASLLTGTLILPYQGPLLMTPLNLSCLLMVSTSNIVPLEDWGFSISWGARFSEQQNNILSREKLNCWLCFYIAPVFTYPLCIISPQ